MENLIEKIKVHRIRPFYNEKDSINVFFAFNDNFVKYFAVELQSIIEHSKPDKKYDFVVFITSLKQENIDFLKSMLPENFSLRFFNMKNFIVENFSDINFSFPAEYSIETYYRLFIPLVVEGYERVLYLDSDIILNKNWEDIFDIDNEHKALLVVKDTISNQLNNHKNSEFCDYLKNTLNMEDVTKYFNAGVSLFILPCIDDQWYIKSLKDVFKFGNYTWQDQDILNKIFKNRTKLIASKWNFNCGQFAYNDEYINILSGDDKEDISEAMKDPRIFHFAASTKPWNYKDIRYAEMFWKYAEKTLFYDELKSNLITREDKYNKLKSFTDKSDKVVLWGASLLLKDLIEHYDIKSDNIVGIIDNNINKKGKYIGKYKIYSPNDLKTIQPGKIIITIANQLSNRKKEIKMFLEDNNLSDIQVFTL